MHYGLPNDCYTGKEWGQSTEMEGITVGQRSLRGKGIHLTLAANDRVLPTGAGCTGHHPDSPGQKPGVGQTTLCHPAPCLC